MSRYSEIRNRIEKKWRGQEGATLLLALLFFLFCAVCGSVVLAAATTSAGRIAGLGKNRQKYQSVEAAARLLENELHKASVTLQETEKITVTVEHVEKENDGEGEDGGKSEETYTTTTYVFSGPDFLNVNANTGKSGTGSSGAGSDESDEKTAGADEDDSIAAAFSKNNGSNEQLSLLEQMLTDADLSTYLKKGEAYRDAGTITISDKEDNTSENAEENLSACQDAWQMAFLTGDNEKSVRRHFTLQLLVPDAENSGSIEAASLVEAELQLYGDGTLEIRLGSGDAEASADSSADAEKYYMLLRGTAEVKTQSRSERTDQKFRHDDESSETLITKKTIISWGDFLITKNAAEAGNAKESGSLTQASREEESSEESSENE